MKTLLILSLCLTLAVTAALLSACGGDASDDSTPAETTKQRVIAVKEGKLIDPDGNEVVLTGINLGGWLLQETWMCALTGSECNSDSFRLLKERGFSDAEIQTLFTTYADNYITEQDIARLAALGLNCLRVPFWYRNFMNEDLSWYDEDPDKNIGFVYLDRVIAWAKAHDMVVILDLHGAPGGQSTDHSTGTIGKNELYTDENNMLATERLWQAIAARYVGNPTVCAYDILNEPMNNSTDYENGWAAGSLTARAHTMKAYRRLIQAIRAVDPDHVITIEGIWSMSYLPDPKKEGWTNMMYQLHLYDSSKDMIDTRIAELVKARDTYGVAVYVGEYNNGDALQEYAYQKYRAEKISRTAWTYKTAKGNQGNWSLYWSSTPAADLSRDSYETILEKWGETLKTESAGWNENPTLKGWLRRYS